MIVRLVSINTENEGHRLLDIPKAALKAETEYGLYCLGSKEKKLFSFETSGNGFKRSRLTCNVFRIGAYVMLRINPPLCPLLDCI